MITIVIPLFNAERYISRALASCCEQEQVSQIVLVDDDSTDGSAEIIESFMQMHADKDLVIIKNQENSGPGISRNKGMDIAQGNYIVFLDADDYYLENRFSRSLEILENNEEIDGVYTPLIMQTDDEVDSDLDENYTLDLKDGSHISFEDMLLRSKGIVSHCGILFRRSFLERHSIRYGDTYWGEDTEMLFAAIQNGNIVYLNEPKTIRKITGNNLTTTLDLELQYDFHKKWFYRMLDADYSREVNYYFLKNLIRKHPIFYKRHTPIYRIPKFIWLIAKVITTPRLWKKLI